MFTCKYKRDFKTDAEIKPGQENDPLLPKNDKLVRGIMLTIRERKALIAFLEALSSPPMAIKVEKLPN